MPAPERVVTYSPALTIVPTYECFNRCSYCNFRVEPGQDQWLALGSAREQLLALQGTGIVEILILSGEVHPHSPRRRAWFEHIFALAKLAASLGFLPHTNAGPLSLEELQQLKAVNVSMGLMLEQVTPALLQTVHRHAPSKRPEVRLQQLAWAGELGIPFTTGLLLGIGETERDRIETLQAITECQNRWGHIQEVILQPYCPGSREEPATPGFPSQELPPLLTLAREILPPEITLQIPPNLVPEPQLLLDCLSAGARDLGGIGPLDHVNPDYPHLHPQTLQQLLSGAGWSLQPRLPIYPQFDSFLSSDLCTQVQGWRQRLDQQQVDAMNGGVMTLMPYVAPCP